MTPLQSFSIEGTPGPLAFEEKMRRLFAVELTIEPPEVLPFKSEITAYCGRKLRFAALRFSPHFTRSQQFHRASRWLVTLQREGTAYVSQDGRSSRVKAGEMFLIDPTRQFEIESDHIYTQSMYLEPDALRRVLPEADALTATAVPCDDGAAGVFRGFVDQIFQAADTLDESAADHLADALPLLVGAALASRRGGGGDLAPSRLRALHRHRILGYVRDNLRNSTLSADEIADAVNLSTRYMYDLFADDVPLMKRVWSERLERCKVDLASVQLRARQISEIAFYWGFNDLTHFSRAFKQRYGMSPREYRQSSLAAAA